MRSAILIPAVLALAWMPAAGAGETYVLGGEESEVVFVSKAPMETFEGKTRRVSGSVALDPNAVDGEIEIVVTVDMASLDTGIGMRNDHMRKNHLHTKEYPEAVFRGAKVTEGSGGAVGAEPVAVTIQGEMDLHGVQRTIEVEARLSLESDDSGPLLRLTSEFPVTLADYDIPRPGFLLMKLGETQTVRIDLVGRPSEAR